MGQLQGCSGAGFARLVEFITARGTTMSRVALSALWRGVCQLGAKDGHKGPWLCYLDARGSRVRPTSTSPTGRIAPPSLRHVPSHCRWPPVEPHNALLTPRN